MDLSRRTLLLSPLTLLYKPSWAALKFPLPQGHFVKAKMPMYPVFPRPDSETQSHARHRWAHPDFRYEIPIGVQGGAWPFKYEILSGPSGAAIGQYYGDPDYGVVKWTPAAGDSGTKTFTVRVTDQELNFIDFTWTTTIDATQFVFIDAAAASSGDGSITSPLKTFTDWYKSDSNDSTYHNKIAVFRAGNYTVFGGSSGSWTVGGSAKTPSIIGHPDEVPVFDFSSSHITASAPAQDIFIGNVTFKNADASMNNSRFMTLWVQVDRLTIWRNTFDTLGNGAVGDDNTTAVFVANTGAKKYNLLLKSNTFTNFTNDGPNGSFMDLYDSSYVVIEENTAKNSNNEYGFWAKTTKEFVTIRANTATENMTRGGISVHYGDVSSPGQPHDHEICWNNIVLPYTVNGRTVLIMGDAPIAANKDHYNSFLYRNTFVGGSPRIRFRGIEDYETDANVCVFDPSIDTTWGWDTSIMTSNVPNIVGTPGKIVDRYGNLKSPYREQFLGIVGHELFDNIAKKPKSPSNIQLE